MEHLFQWCMAHQALCGIGATLVSFVIGWALPNDKIAKAGFFVSQFIRRAFGAKLEEKIENVVDAFDKGMKGDNPK
jgi:hypothetical protein